MRTPGRRSKSICPTLPDRSRNSRSWIRVRSSEENVKLLSAEYKAGIASNLEAVDAENTRRQANLDLERELYDARRLELELRAASGDESLAPPAYPRAGPGD